jgi:hypothetical protein
MTFFDLAVTLLAITGAANLTTYLVIKAYTRLTK